ncbi:MAG: hypothetical protein VYE73_03225, partial [Acidobacteriota bacterium]|nr:hypothetical protein [Acidobacteriota bacterium]
MARPKDVRVIDLMLESPAGGAGMGMEAARKLTRDSGTDDFTHHPAQYLFQDAGSRMEDGMDVDQVVAMMDHF